VLSQPSSEIWKYEVQIVPEFARIMPAYAEVIYVAVQDGIPYMWARVSPDEPKTERTFYVHGTGRPITEGCVHLGSFMLHDGAYVGHLFEPALVGEDF
jgi:hypothetical protein